MFNESYTVPAPSVVAHSAFFSRAGSFHDQFKTASMFSVMLGFYWKRFPGWLAYLVNAALLLRDAKMCVGKGAKAGDSQSVIIFNTMLCLSLRSLSVTLGDQCYRRGNRVLPNKRTPLGHCFHTLKSGFVKVLFALAFSISFASIAKDFIPEDAVESAINTYDSYESRFFSRLELPGVPMRVIHLLMFACSLMTAVMCGHQAGFEQAKANGGEGEILTQEQQRLMRLPYLVSYLVTALAVFAVVLNDLEEGVTQDQLSCDIAFSLGLRAMSFLFFEARAFSACRKEAQVPALEFDSESDNSGAPAFAH